MPLRPIRYEDDDQEPKKDEGAESEGEATESESAPAAEGPPEGVEGGEGAAPAEGGEGDVGMQDQGMSAPAGHDEWLANFEFALQTNPVLFGMAQHYAEMMSQQQGDQGAAGDVPPEDPGMVGGEGAPPEGAGAADDSAQIDAVLSGGAEDMPNPGEEAPTQEPAGYAMSDQMGRGGRGMLGGLAGGVAGAGIGALTGTNPLATAGVGAGLGTAGGLAMQNNTIPVAYQAELQKMERRVAAVEKSAKATREAQAREIATLKQINAWKDSEMIVYQLQHEGYEALSTPAQAQQLTAFLAALPPEGREAKVNEIRAFYKKDESMQYAAAGAPVGGFAQVSGEKVESNKNSFDDKKLEVALKYMRSPEGRGKTWEQCQAYAMGGTVVTG